MKLSDLIDMLVEKQEVLGLETDAEVTFKLPPALIDLESITLVCEVNIPDRGALAKLEESNSVILTFQVQ